jgi:hypothetical protein
LDIIIRKTAVYKLSCTISHEAVKVAYNEIFANY